MKAFTDFVIGSSRTLYVVAGVALNAMVFLTGADVVLRYLNRPITGTYELVGLLGAVVIGFSIPQTSRLKAHVLMDFLTSRLAPRVQGVLYRLTRALGIILFLIITWNVLVLGDRYRTLREATLVLQVPLYPVAYGIAVSCFIECLVLFIDLVTADHEKKGEA